MRKWHSGHSPRGCQGMSGFDHKRATTAQLALSWWILLKNACDAICLLGKALPGREPSPELCMLLQHPPGSRFWGSSLALWHHARDQHTPKHPCNAGTGWGTPTLGGQTQKERPSGWGVGQTNRRKLHHQLGCCVSGQGESQSPTGSLCVSISPRTAVMAPRHPGYTETLNAPTLNFFLVSSAKYFRYLHRKALCARRHVSPPGITQAATDTPPPARG